MSASADRGPVRPRVESEMREPMRTHRGLRCALWLALPAVAVLLVYANRRPAGESPPASAGRSAPLPVPASQAGLADVVAPGRIELADVAEPAREDASASSGQASPRLRLSVVDEADAPVVGAAVHFAGLSDEAVGVASGATDDQGQISLPPPGEAGFLVVEHRAHPRGERFVSAGQCAEVRLVLSAPASMGGRVVDSRGARVTAEPWVLVYPERNPPSRRRLDALMRGALDLPSTSVLVRADPAGRFEVDGLDPRETYTVFVGGNGFACSAPLRRMSPSGEEVTVVAGPVFGALLRFVSEGQTELLSDSRLWRSMSPRWTWAPELGEGLAAGSLGAVLAGIPLGLTGNVVLDAGTPVALIGSRGSERIGPIQVEGQLIGHDPVETTVSLPRFTSGNFEVVQVPLRARSARTARLDIELRGIAGSSSSISTLHQDVGVVALQPVEESAPYLLKLDSWSNQEIVLDEVPVGVYAVGIHTPLGFLAHAPVDGATVHVPESGARIVFDLSASCEIEILVGRRGEVGQLYSGELSVGLSRTFEDGRTQSGVLVFDRAPFVLSGALEQTYELTLYRPFYTPQPVALNMKDAMGPERRATVTIVE